MSIQQLIFALASMLAYVSRTDMAIRQIEKLSWDWIKMDCSGGKCYGLLAVSHGERRVPDDLELKGCSQVHRFEFALVIFHAILALLLLGVKTTKAKRAAVQNGSVVPTNGKTDYWLTLYLAQLVGSEATVILLA